MSTTNLPEPQPESHAAQQDDSQLTKLSSVLNGLKRGAAAMRSQASQVIGAVHSGTYQVDSLLVSRCIVGDCLAPR